MAMNEEEISLTRIKGIGESRARGLIKAGYSTILSVAMADCEKLTESINGLTSKKAEEIISEAKKMLEGETIEEPTKAESVQVDEQELDRLRDEISAQKSTIEAMEASNRQQISDRLAKAKEKEDEWWRSKNSHYEENGKEFYALQERMMVDIPSVGIVEARIVRASFSRIGHGGFVLLLCSNRTIHTSDRGDLVQSRWHIMSWELGGEKPYHIYTPMYYDSDRHLTAQQVADVINGVEFQNAEQRFWEESKAWVS
ncbi:MAG: hypothetical protein KJ587_20335 [Alphaproteobacteria bacterium]|nr:hypothetical protein [Alphaproteobacteria bacterium]